MVVHATKDNGVAAVVREFRLLFGTRQNFGVQMKVLNLMEKRMENDDQKPGKGGHGKPEHPPHPEHPPKPGPHEPPRPPHHRPVG